MKKGLFLLAIHLVLLISAQAKIKVIDAETQIPIPFAKIIFEDSSYRNTEENGEILINEDEKIIKIDAFGYENYIPQSIEKIYLLQPKVINIEEVVIKTPSYRKSYKIGEAKNSKLSFVASKSTWMVCKEIKFENPSSKPLFLKSIHFYTKIISKSKATIKVNVYDNYNGLPGELIRSEVVLCKKGGNVLEMKSPILFPKEGIIIGFEWILNQENSYYAKKKSEEGITREILMYNPHIMGLKENNNRIIGSLVNGEWKFQKLSNQELNGYNVGVEVELTD